MKKDNFRCKTEQSECMIFAFDVDEDCTECECFGECVECTHWENRFAKKSFKCKECTREEQRGETINV